MKNKFFKNKIQMISYIIIFFILLGLFIYLGTQNFNDTPNDDHEKFDYDFSLVDKNNVFKYVNNTAARIQINSGNCIIFFGTNKSEWVNYYAKILNDIAKESGITSISYYDFIDDRKNNNGTYQSILEILKNYVKVNDMNVKNIYAPTLVVIKNNKIIYFNDETAFISGNITPEEYWTEYQIGLKKETLTTVFHDYLNKEDNINGK